MCKIYLNVMYLYNVTNGLQKRNGQPSSQTFRMKIGFVQQPHFVRSASFLSTKQNINCLQNVGHRRMVLI